MREKTRILIADDNQEFSKTLTTAADVRAIYGGYWTSDSSFSASGVYCWRRTS